jgi:Protein of unknown function (DUF2892)
MMTKMGPTERVVRIALGVVLLSCLFMLPGDLRWVGLVGLFPLITGLFDWCPFYVLLDWLTLD